MSTTFESQIDCNMEWSFESCAMWSLGLLFLLICVINYREYQKLAIAKTTSFKLTRIPKMLLLFQPLLMISLPLLLLYRQLVDLFLSLKHGRKFAGLLEGQDVLYAICKAPIYHVIFIVEYDASNSESFHDFAKKSIRETLLTKFKCPKSLGIIQKGWGYFYLLRDEVTFEDCITTLATAPSLTGDISFDDVTRLMSDCSGCTMPAGNKALWQVLIGTQPINHGKEAQNSTKKSYPVVFKGHHALADAMHLFKSIIAMFADDEGGGNVVKSRLQEVTVHSKQTGVWMKKVRQYVEQLRVALLSPAVLFLNAVLQKTEPNLLQVSRLTRKTNICAVIDESQQHLQAMKRIRRKFPGSSFEDIYCAAFSASLSDYYKKQSQQIPEYLVAEVPSVPECATLADQGIHKIKRDGVNCINSLGGYARKIPTSISCRANRQSVVDALEFIRRERILLKATAEREVYYWGLKVLMAAIPYPMIEMLAKETQYSALGIVNIVGIPNFTVFGGCRVKDIVGCPANRVYGGISCSSFTYNNIWKLSLIVDVSIISKEEDVRSILNETCKYILMLDSDS